jgi:hypothetical protein
LAAKSYPRHVTRRMLGTTPFTYRYDPNNPIGHNDPLLFQKAGFEDHQSHFKAAEPRLHCVMKPTINKAR